MERISVSCRNYANHHMHHHSQTRCLLVLLRPPAPPQQAPQQPAVHVDGLLVGGDALDDLRVAQAAVVGLGPRHAVGLVHLDEHDGHGLVGVGRLPAVALGVSYF